MTEPEGTPKTETSAVKAVDSEKQSSTTKANSTTKASSTVAESTTASAAQSKSVQADKPKSGGRGLAIFSLLLSLLAIAAIAGTWYQNQVQKVTAEAGLAVDVANIGGNVSRLGDSIVRLQSQQDNVVSQAQLSNQIMQSSAKLESRLDDVDRAQEEQVRALADVRESLSKGGTDYVVDEVAHLLKLANTNALFNSDVDAAIRALQLADVQLKALASPKFSEVRVLINREIAELNAVPRIDTENISARLTALAGRIPSLPLENEPPAYSKVDLLSSEKTQEITWRGELRKIWHDMVNAVQVQRVDQPPKPLLAPEQRYFLNQNLQLSLSKAELALLQSRSAIYVSSMSEASDWLTAYFDLKNSAVQSVLSEIASLRDTPISVEVPSVTKSYDRLQSIQGGL